MSACSAVSALPSCETGEEKSPPSKSGHRPVGMQALPITACLYLHHCSVSQQQDHLGLAVPLDSKWVYPNLFSAVFFCEGQEPTKGLCLLSHPKAG